ncbi:MAG: NAD(P)H-dependent oxidoreductase [Marinovum algicola]|jgi:chromate reductase|uniref:NAD(P)H-dependent FMN reductase n=1 Tax=Marinovum algicola TaxID=42444 RepID=A0A975ZMW8_9RHOB|nr:MULTISPECIES: NAD(P)H-dependent oxidoreductase [Marinovum]MDD9740502.1 NAD(P)H-dependent oxidoreductase [Marinovum sp. SP66]SEJ24613.1 NAD(P)H-dependent FMN reductase [Marinovum algicola]SLN47740.1 NADPH azoreductase [Marinovum algicola]
MAVTLLGISGSLRAESSNTKLMREALRLFGAAETAEADLRLPLYDGDLEAEEGIPAPARRLADQIAAADALVISGPEYNKGVSGVLKNALDWISRTDVFPWQGKPVAIMSAASGRAGGERTQMMLRASLVAFRPRLLQGPEVLVAQGREQFDAEGRLINDRYEKTLTALMAALREEVRRQGLAAGTAIDHSA